MTQLPEAARRNAVFAELGPVEAQDVSALGSAVEHAVGDVIFADGDPGDALYVIVSGSVRIAKATPESVDRKTLATLREGDVFGEMALLAETTRSASAIAGTNCRLLRIGRDGFAELLESQDPVAFKVLLGLSRLLCARLTRVDAELAAALQGGKGPAPSDGWVSLERLRTAIADPMRRA